MTNAGPIFAQHRQKPLAIAILAGLGLLFVACGVMSLCVAFSSGMPLGGRLLMIVLAAVSLFLPAWFALASLRIKIKTGRWTIPPEGRQAHLNRIATEKPSRTLSFASSPAFTKVMNGVMVVLAALNIWLQVRQEVHAFQIFIAAVWSAVAVMSLWQLLHTHRATPKSTD